MSTASAGAQAGTVVVKVSGTTTSRITTPAVTASSNYVTTTASKTTTSKQVGTPAVVATNSVKTTNTGASTTRITTPAVTAGHVTTTGSSGNTKSVGTPAVTVYTASDGSIHTLRKAETMQNMTSEQFKKISQSKNLKAPAPEENSFMDGVHMVLDVAGFIPGAGTLADLANGIIYAAEGDWVNAGMSAAAVFIDGATSGRLVTKASKELIGEGLETVTEKAIKNGVEEFGEEAVEKASKETAENVTERTGKEIVEGGSIPKVELNAKVRNIIDTISNEYKVNGQCDSFARCLVEKLEENGIQYDIIRIDSSYGIYSDKAADIIGVNFHYGVKIDDMIYDNMTPNGINFSSWLDDLGLTSQPQAIINWSVVDEIFSS